MSKTIHHFDELDLSKTYTYADYLTWKFQERVELIKGHIFKMSPAPNTQHQRISANLHGYIWMHFNKSNCQVFHAPFDVRLFISETDPNISKKRKKKAERLSDGSILTVVQPDITVICDPSKIDDRGGIGAPDLVVEILSPGNSSLEMREKFSLYENNGIKEYWVIFPAEEVIQVYDLNQEDRYIGLPPLTPGDIISSGQFPGMKINVSDIFG